MHILIDEVVRYSGRVGIIVGVYGNWLEIRLEGDTDTVWANMNEITFLRNA